MSELQIFENKEFGRVRTIVKDGIIWFVGKDVAEALGYSDTNKAVAMHIDDEDKQLNDKTSSSFGQRGATLINESGIYSLVLSSKLPTAKKFKRWVTSEVLPSIRKHGMYATPATAAEIISNPDTMIEILQALKTEREQRVAHEKKIEADKPKVIFADSVAASNSTILVRELAKILRQNGVEVGQNSLFEKLRELGYLIKKKGSDYNMPTQKSIELGIIKMKETSIAHSDGHVTISKTPKVTGKGQIYFVDLFMKKKQKKMA